MLLEEDGGMSPSDKVAELIVLVELFLDSCSSGIVLVNGTGHRGRSENFVLSFFSHENFVSKSL